MHDDSNNVECSFDIFFAVIVVQLDHDGEIAVVLLQIWNESEVGHLCLWVCKVTHKLLQTFWSVRDLHGAGVPGDFRGCVIVALRIVEFDQGNHIFQVERRFVFWLISYLHQLKGPIVQTIELHILMSMLFCVTLGVNNV